MAMLRICTADGCQTKTLGGRCLEHEGAEPVTAEVAGTETEHPAELLAAWDEGDVATATLVS